MGQSVKIIVLGALFAISGCGSRKREVQTFSSDFKYKASLDTSASFMLQLQKRNAELLKNVSSSSVIQIQYEGEQGDSLSIKQFGPDGKLVSETRIKGKGKANLSNSSSDETSEKNLVINESKKEKLEASGSSKTEASGSQENKQAKVERKGPVFLWGFFIYLICLIILLYYLNKHFKWFGYSKKHVLNDDTSENTFAKK